MPQMESQNTFQEAPPRLDPHYQSQGQGGKKPEESKYKKQSVPVNKGNLKTNNPQYKQLVQNNISKNNNKDVQNLISQYVQRKEQKSIPPFN